MATRGTTAVRQTVRGANRGDFGVKKVTGLFEDFEKEKGGHADFWFSTQLLIIILI